MMLFRRKRKDYSSAPLSRMAIKRLLHDKPAIISISVIVFATIIAIACYLITPDSTPEANLQFLELATKRPGFKVGMLKTRNNEAQKHVNFFYKMLFGTAPNYEEIPFSAYKIEVRVRFPGTPAR